MTDQQPRILITGSRIWTDERVMLHTLRAVWKTYAHLDPILVHGGARGADLMAGKIWTKFGGKVEVHALTDEDWRRYPGAAGFRRNAKMVNLGATICLAFIANNSAGASHCANLAEVAGIPTKRIRKY